MSGYIIAGTAIWAIGRTEQEAVAEYNRTADEDATLESLSRNPRSGWTFIYPCTEALYNKVLTHGGDISWDDSGPVADVMKT